MTRQKNTDLTTTELGILDRWYEDKSGLTIFTQCGKKSKISSKFRNEVSKVKSKLETLKGNRISITTRMSTSNGKKSWTTNWFTDVNLVNKHQTCLLYTSTSPRDRQKSRMPSSA